MIGRLVVMAVMLFGCASPARSDGGATDTGSDIGDAWDATFDSATDVARGPAVARITIDTARPLRHVSDRFLSVAIDSSQLAGGRFWGPDATPSEGGIGAMHVSPFDFSRAELRTLTRELSPALLRLGGTEADVLYYDLSDTPASSPPPGYGLVLTRAEWDGAMQFARDLGLQVLFTLDAGAGPRDSRGRWMPDNARSLVSYAASHGDPVTVWELGNEVGAYSIVFSGFSVSATQYASDLQTARTLIDSTMPGVRLAAPAEAYWPTLGEIGSTLSGTLPLAGSLLDIVTWHFYPMESTRCPVALRPATVENALATQTLAEFERWSTRVESQTTANAPSAEVWLGETGNAQCGGQPGVSDAFVGGFWWLDELGRAARHGEQVVIRQALAGANYGLLDATSLVPRPDYWNSVLWHRLMGTTVLDASLVATSGEASRIRAYAHCAPGSSGGVTVLVINTDSQFPAGISFDRSIAAGATAYRLAASALGASDLQLNGSTLSVHADGSLPSLDGVVLGDTNALAPLMLPPATYAFVVLPHAAAAACP